MSGRKALQRLQATAMPVHIAEAADIHQDVEAKRLTRGKATQQLVVAAAMAHAEVDNLSPLRLAQSGDAIPYLPEGIMAGAIEQRGGDLGFERRAALDQVNHRRCVDGSVLHQLARCLLQIAPRLHLVGVAAAYFTSVGATFTSRSSSVAAWLASSG